MARPEIEVSVDWKALQRALAEAPDRLYREIRRALTQFSVSFLGKFRTERIASRSGAGNQPPLARKLTSRSGFLRKSFKHQISGREGDAMSLRSDIFSDAPYAAIHEAGGTIVPRESSWLTIPLRAAKTASGVARGPAKSFSDTFFVEKEPGKLLLMQRQDDEVVPLFVLVKSVTIKPRLRFVASFRKSVADLSRRLDDAIGRALKPT